MSVNIYYSGADAAGEEQKSPAKSLGGIISGTALPNSYLNALFGTISDRERKEEESEYKAVFFKNETGSTITNLSLYFDMPVLADRAANFKVAAVTVSNNQIEKIANRKAKPYTGTFVEADGVANTVVLVASLDANASIGVWLERTPIAKTFPACTSMEDYLANEEKSESVDVVISWD